MHSELVTKYQRQVLIFTDLDGTLLDHYSYEHQAAQACMDRLMSHGIPIIPNTSKTLAELRVLRERLGLNGPFIVENGAAVYMPRNFLPEKPRGAVWQDGFWVKTFSSKRHYWLGLISKVTPEFGHLFEAFSSMSTDRIMEVTGLEEEDAVLSSQRLFGEPLLWKGNEEEMDTFIAHIKRLGATPLKGGRFLHICGDNNKGVALSWLLKEYQRQHKTVTVSSIALGDGKNDIAMLEIADTAVRIASPVNEPPEVERSSKLYTSKGYGPVGWAEVLDQLIPESVFTNTKTKE
ncbi:HAD-IIB family hydrolase [Glaciecola sp. MH2013]|nr:HAD-IIB family hydrolase [Glaciecola sp. MH2013]MBF7072892.1 HAD-IIB family hydrolase [Glaciecola sp. MH2013]